MAAAVDAVAMRRRTTNDDAVDRRCLAGAMSNIIHRSTTTGKPRFDAGRQTTQHLGTTYCRYTLNKSKLSELVNVLTLVLSLVRWWWCCCCLFLRQWTTVSWTTEVTVMVVEVVARRQRRPAAAAAGNGGGGDGGGDVRWRWERGSVRQRQWTTAR